MEDKTIKEQIKWTPAELTPAEGRAVFELQRQLAEKTAEVEALRAQLARSRRLIGELKDALADEILDRVRGLGHR